MTQPYDIVIGLEVHVQLLTRTKLFCACNTAFGAPPNTQTCPVCTGMPGTLPVMNRRAFELALRTAVALNCEIAQFTKWDRKQYYYPDLPKGYQISQFDLPFSSNGYLEISDPKGRFEAKRVGIIRAHLEEDAGKSMHDEQAGAADSKIDLNRAGTPLLEIVSQPDLRSPQEAGAYLNELKLLLTYLGVSDCNMQEGSLRVDANVNLHVHADDGQRIPTPIIEIKNMNSFRAVERALIYEAQRQFDAWNETGQRLGDVPKQTRGWDDVELVTRGQRHKEESSDYRYFPDPDLVPVTVTDEQIEAVRAGLGELPADLRHRLELTFNISPYDSDVIVNKGRALVDYYVELALLCGDGKLASNWVQQDVLRELNERNITIEQYRDQVAAPVGLAELIKSVKNGALDTSRARNIYTEMASGGVRLSGEAIVSVIQNTLDQGLTETDLVELCKVLVVASPRIVADVKSGKEQAVGAFIGLAKKKNPDVNPARVKEICLELIRKM